MRSPTLVASVAREVRSRRPARWRRTEDDHVELWHEDLGRWQRYLPWTASVLAALDEGLGYDAMLERVRAAAPPGEPEWRMRRFLYGLDNEGIVEVVWEATPSLLGGRYEVEATLGRGGSGVAFRCRDRASRDLVVVKRPWDFLGPLEAADRVVRHERDVLQRLDHPGVVRLLDAFEEDGRFHVVRAFVDGDPLRRAAGTGIADRARLAALARPIAETLAHLHARGLLLLDVAPGNFLLSQDGSIVLIDVGSCRELHDGAVKVRRATGSPPYASPEALAGGVATARSDVCGLGRLVYTLATGRVPLPQAPFAEQPPPVDPRVAEVVARLAADDPAMRPASMDDAVAALRELAA